MGKALWGVGGVRGEEKPNWVVDTARYNAKENTFATNAGWVVKSQDGTEETLVSIANLKTKLGAASPINIKWGTGTFTAGASRTVRVSFNEKVTVTGSPTITLTTTAGNVTATYTSTTGQGNVLVFTFTVPVAGTVVSVGAQSIALAGGTIVETGVTPTVNADLVITAAVASAAGSKTSV